MNLSEISVESRVLIQIWSEVAVHYKTLSSWEDLPLSLVIPIKFNLRYQNMFYYHIINYGTALYICSVSPCDMDINSDTLVLKLRES